MRLFDSRKIAGSSVAVALIAGSLTFGAGAVFGVGQAGASSTPVIPPHADHAVSALVTYKCSELNDTITTQIIPFTLAATVPTSVTPGRPIRLKNFSAGMTFSTNTIGKNFSALATSITGIFTTVDLSLTGANVATVNVAAKDTASWRFGPVDFTPTLTQLTFEAPTPLFSGPIATADTTPGIVSVRPGNIFVTGVMTRQALHATHPTKPAKLPYTFNCVPLSPSPLSFATITPAPLSVSPQTLRAAVTGVSYAATLSETGGTAPFTWSYVSGPVPPGLTLFSSGRITGTPTEAGSYSFVASVKTKLGTSASGQISVTVLAPGSPASTVATTVSSPYQCGVVTKTVTSGPLTVAATVSMTLPESVDVGSTFGISHLQVSLSGTLGSTLKSYTQFTATFTTVDMKASTTAAPSVNIASPSWTFSYTHQKTTPVLGRIPTPRFTNSALWTAGDSPGTISVSPANIKATLIPTLSGTKLFTKPIRLTCVPTSTPVGSLGSVAVVAKPVLHAVTLPEATVGRAYGAAFAVTNGVGPYTWSIANGILPPGLELGSSTGKLTGSPTKSGTFTFTVSVIDADSNTVTVAESITVVGSITTPMITTSVLPHGIEGKPYSVTIAVAKGMPPYSWSKASILPLPTGLTLNSKTGVLSGTPTVTGTFAITIQVADSENVAAPLEPYTLVITPGPGTGTPGCSGTGVGSASHNGGYWLAAANGAVYSCGNAPFFGSLATLNITPASPIVGIAATGDGKGYWLVAKDGGLFAFGDAKFHGSMGGRPLNAPIVGMTATSAGGYYEVAADGGLFSFGPGATFHGSMGGKPLNKPIVGMAETSMGGYYEVAADGGLFSFGPGATFHGSMGGKPLNKPIVGMSLLSNGGYYEVATDGGIFSFGAPFHGSTGCLALNEQIVGMAVSENTTTIGVGTVCGFNAKQQPGGYQFVAADGGVFSFGNSLFAGSLGGNGVADVVGIAIP